jgi:UDP-N-acetylmuramyl pentapeptide phosphotransferase/UDP-N-acetylglucosamine-1-phosphate transferase
VFAIAALIYPLLDTLRVFITRALKGQSPFNADRNHLHHKLIDCGFSHVKTVLIIYSFSIITIGASLLTYYFNQPTLSLITIVSTSLVFLIFVLSLYNRAAKKNVQ